jgi:hypothetical protein
VVAGIVTAVMSSSKGGDADDKLSEVQAQGGTNARDSAAFAGPCDEVVGLRGDAETLANVSMGLFIGGGR